MHRCIPAHRRCKRRLPFACVPRMLDVLYNGWGGSIVRRVGAHPNTVSTHDDAQCSVVMSGSLSLFAQYRVIHREYVAESLRGLNRVNFTFVFGLAVWFTLHLGIPAHRAVMSLGKMCEPMFCRYVSRRAW